MNELLWNRVEAALDQRADPFADSHLAADLARDPDVELAAKRLCDRLARLPAPSESPRRTRPWLVALCTAAAIVAITAATLDRSPEAGGAATDMARSTRVTGGVTLVVERIAPDEPRLARIMHEPRRVVAWTLEGDNR